VDADQPQHRSQLFTVRIWPEDLGDGRAEWRGRVQHVLSGEAHYFREWPALVAALSAMLAENDGPGIDAQPQQEPFHLL
jgi:hypothetical protein